MIHDGLWDAYNDIHMGSCAEMLATDRNYAREQQDEYSMKSYQRAQDAQEKGYFSNEIIPLTNSKGISIDSDEEPGKAKFEKIPIIKPVFEKNGTITAANASGINDGAAAVLLMNADEAEKRNIKPLARIASFPTAGVDPSIMGIGPVYASKKALAKANWTVNDLELIESNEAFAAQACAVNKEMGWDPAIVNVNGGAIAIGHPIGASGCRILNTLLFEMQRRDVKKAIATLCIGGGMGVAMCLEKP